MSRWVWLAVVATLAATFLVAAPLGGARTSATQAVVKTALNKKLHKRILVDGSGRTLYMFTGDIGGVSVCTPQKLGASCVHQWPPLKSKRKPIARGGVIASKLGVTKRSDGVRQAVYNGHPLYHYYGDEKPGDAFGQKYYGAWYVLTPTGKPIK